MICLLLIMLVSATDEDENVRKSNTKLVEQNGADKPIFVKIEEDEYVKLKQNSSNYIGVSYNERDSKWCVRRWSKNENKLLSNGYYDDEGRAAHASDTLARKLIASGEKGHKLNFPDDQTEVYPEQKKNYIGVYQRRDGKWCTRRRSKNENKMLNNGTYKDDKTAAHASDTLARKLMANGEKGHKLNFPDDDTDVYPEEVKCSSNYIGVTRIRNGSKWGSYRWSKIENKMIFNGTYKDEESAALASDTLARQLMTNCEKGHKFNFPDDDNEVYPEEYPKKKRKRLNNVGNSQDSKFHQISKK